MTVLKIGFPSGSLKDSTYLKGRATRSGCPRVRMYPISTIPSWRD